MFVRGTGASCSSQCLTVWSKMKFCDYKMRFFIGKEDHQLHSNTEHYQGKLYFFLLIVFYSFLCYIWNSLYVTSDVEVPKLFLNFLKIGRCDDKGWETSGLDIWRVDLKNIGTSKYFWSCPTEWIALRSLSPWVRICWSFWCVRSSLYVFRYASSKL